MLWVCFLALLQWIYTFLIVELIFFRDRNFLLLEERNLGLYKMGVSKGPKALNGLGMAYIGNGLFNGFLLVQIWLKLVEFPLF